MRTPALVSIVIALHVLAVGAFIFIQGCESIPRGGSSGQSVEPPARPNMPPTGRQTTGPRIPTPPDRPHVDPPARTMDGATHEVAKGETLSHIAKHYGIGWRELAEYNNMTDPGKLRVGDKLIIPPYAKVQPTGGSGAIMAPVTPPEETVTMDRSVASVYVVQAGDNLTKIARKYGITVSELRTANQLQSDMIRVGQKLGIPAEGAAAITTSTDIPPPGDAGVPPEAPGTGEVKIEDIVMPEGGLADSSGDTRAPPPVEQGNDLEYIVMDGDTLDDIARLYIVGKQSLIDYNGLQPDQELKVGDKIKIPSPSL